MKKHNKKLAILMAGIMATSYLPEPVPVENFLDYESAYESSYEAPTHETKHDETRERPHATIPTRPIMPKPGQTPTRRKRPTCGGCKDEEYIDPKEKHRRQKIDPLNTRANLKNTHNIKLCHLAHHRGPGNQSSNRNSRHSNKGR